MTEMTRAFIAITFNDEVIKEVARVQESVGKNLFTGKFTELENLHLTLKFLGEVDEGTLGKVGEILRKIQIKGFDAKLGDVGIFKQRGNPKIVWIKINGKGVWDLQKAIDKSLKGIFQLEERFMSHLTVARIKYVKDGKGFEEKIKSIHAKEIKFRVEGFKLIKSELDKIGPAYTVIEEYTLK